MIEVITSREFRENQKNYFDKIDDGAEIIVQRGKNKSYKIVPLKADDTLMSKEGFYKMIEEALEQRKNGEFEEIKSAEEFASALGL